MVTNQLEPEYIRDEDLPTKPQKFKRRQSRSPPRSTTPVRNLSSKRVNAEQSRNETVKLKASPKQQPQSTLDFLLPKTMGIAQNRPKRMKTPRSDQQFDYFDDSGENNRINLISDSHDEENKPVRQVNKNKKQKTKEDVISTDPTTQIMHLKKMGG